MVNSRDEPGRTLVMGWFSFDGVGVAAGDLMARDVVCAWLTEAGCAWDVATTPWTGPGVDWRTVDPTQYSQLVFVCGPFGQSISPPFLERFPHCRRIGINLSMLQPLEEWNPFDVLFERDSTATTRPDITFLAPSARVPLVGVVLVPPQPEYGRRARHARANEIIGQLTRSRDMAIVPIDTAVETNAGGLRSPDEIETLIARVDVLVTTRLHGLVLALKNGVPVVAVDPIMGGAKMMRQARRLGWPVVMDAETVTLQELHSGFDFCLTEEARTTVLECRAGALADLHRLRGQVIAAVRAGGPIARRPEQPLRRSRRRSAQSVMQAILRLVGGD